jgi:hypothetical protein
VSGCARIGDSKAFKGTDMSDLKVADTTVPGILDSLRKGEWLVPEFQRDFVWSTDQVSALVQSVLEARPIGMVTLWEQQDTPSLPLERVSILDQDPLTRQSSLIYFGDATGVAKQYALLDGRQRCTAIAMAFGGFRPANGQYRYSGRYFLDVKQADRRKRVKFIRSVDVTRQELLTDANCVAKGLFPLASSNVGESTLAQWMRYLQALGNPENYPGGVLPSADELARRNRILQEAFEGIVKTKMAVYIVPEKYTLAEICDIFETLNTTGTKVSTVDLIHSWLYADTINDPAGPFLLRDWLNDLGQLDGATGWSSAEDRPELMAQFVAACHVALLDKVPPRSIGTARPEPITSVKSSDLLALPAAHWKQVKENEEVFALALGAAQRVVADGFFPWQLCPYPVSLSVYVALRWHFHFDPPATHPWGLDELNALFKAFFWHNALTRRYDQGFLSQIGTDIGQLKAILMTRTNYSSSGEWASEAETQLRRIVFEYPVPSRAELITWITSGNQSGALQKALTLPMLASARSDLVNANLSLAFPSSTAVELHHIYPKEWCRNNRSGLLEKVLDPKLAGSNYTNSVANLMPLSRQSNNAWRQQFPAQFISQHRLTFGPNEANLKNLFIDETAFGLLVGGTENIKAFWDRRAELIADSLLRNTRVIL